MKIIIITTANEDMKETGFGKMKACVTVFESLKKRFDDVSISSCTTIVDLKKVIAKKPDVVVLAVKYVQLTGDKKIWLAEYFENAGINH